MKPKLESEDVGVMVVAAIVAVVILFALVAFRGCEEERMRIEAEVEKAAFTNGYERVNGQWVKARP